MNRKFWSKKQKEILEVVNLLIDGHLPVTLFGKDGQRLRTRLTGIHFHRQIPYLLMLKPQALTESRNVKDLLFKMSGLPALGFSCPITRESGGLMATMLPDTIFQLELRDFNRLAPRQGSMASFFIKDRSRVSICMMENISMSGVKLLGAPSHPVRSDVIVGPCTLSLAGRDALISREVTVSKAVVARANDKEGGNGQLGMGLKFDLSDPEKEQLKEHIDFLMNK